MADWKDLPTYLPYNYVYPLEYCCHFLKIASREKDEHQYFCPSIVLIKFIYLCYYVKL